MNETLTPNAASPEYVQDMAKVMNLTPAQRLLCCDLGYFNEAIRGYLILAMQDSGFTPDQIDKALVGLERAFSDANAEEATQAYLKL